MALVCAQAIKVQNAAGSSATLNSAWTTTAGSLVVGHNGCSGGSAIHGNHAMSGSLSGALIKVAGADDGSGSTRHSVWYKGAVPGGLENLTVSGTGADFALGIYHEVTGADPGGPFIAGEFTCVAYTATANPQTTAVTNSVADSIFFAGMIYSGAGNPDTVTVNSTGSSPTGWALEDSAESQELDADVYWPMSVPHLIVSSSSSKIHGWTADNATGVKSLVCFRTVQSGLPQFGQFSNPVATITNELSWTHTPISTPRGIVVLTVHTTTGDAVTGVTYGGTAMTQLTGSPVVVAGEGGEVTGWFLGASVPTGAQTVVATFTGSATGLKQAGCWSLTGSTDLEIVDVDATINSTAQANPSVTLSLGGRSCFVAIGLYSGQNATSGITPFTSWTARLEEDFGADVGGWYSYDPIATADVSAGWTQGSDDAAAIAVAIGEVVAAGGVPFFMQQEQLNGGMQALGAAS